MSLIPIDKGELEIGKPLPWDIHDQHNHLLMAQGEVIQTAQQLLALLERTPCRELTWESAEEGATANFPLVEEFTPPPLPSSSTDARLQTAAPSAQGKSTPEKSGKEPQGTFTFDDMRLKVGDHLQIQPPALISTERFIVKLIGYVKNVSILVTAPFDKGLRLQLVGNEKMVVRVFTSQNAFGFGSSIIKVCKLPFDYLHLSFPTEVQGTVVRKAPRVRTKIIAAVTNINRGKDSDSAPAIITNISASGALLDAHRNLGQKGDAINLSFRVNLHNIDAYLTTKAVICAVFADEPAEGKKSAGIHHGIEFVDLQPNDSVILQSLIYQHMIEQPGTMM